MILWAEGREDERARQLQAQPQSTPALPSTTILEQIPGLQVGAWGCGVRRAFLSPASNSSEVHSWAAAALGAQNGSQMGTPRIQALPP